MRRKLLLLSMISVLLTLGTVHTQAQSKDEDIAAKLPFKKKMKFADNLYKIGSWYTAEIYYMQLKKEQPRNPYVTYQLAECLKNMRDYPPAAHYYEEVLALAPEEYPDVSYRAGQMRKQNGDYNEAIEHFQYFIKNYRGKDKKRKIYAQREIDGCKMAIQTLADPERVFVKNAGPNINTINTELSPMPLGDTALLFATMSAKNIIEVGKDKRKDYVSRLMWAPKEFDRTRVKDSFEVAMKFEDGRFNDPKFHVGNGSWSPGGSRFYFTRCNDEDSMKIKCKIYFSELKKGTWTAPKLVPGGINEDESSSTHPHSAYIGKKEVLFFASDRKMQSAGGWDIWYSIYDSSRNEYRRPQNAGKKVNTPIDEITPFYDTRRGKLFYASNGWPGMGGFDVYSAEGGPTSYRNVKNMGYPINSPADDYYYVQDPSAKDNGYVVSNRVGSLYKKNPTCCDDIWRVIKEPNFYVKGIAINEVDNKPVGEVVIKLTDSKANVQKDTFFSRGGDFLFYTPLGNNYVITADKQGYISGRTTVSTFGKSVMDPDDTTLVTVYMRKITDDYEFRVQNVYYNFAKGDFQPDSYAALDSMVRFMQDNPSISVEIRSYTDNIGDDESNYELSVRRAEAVAKYLASKGIDRGRMIARGEGKKNPIRPNTVNGKDNPTGRQYNRRTEFRVIGDLPNMRIVYDQNRPEYIDKSGNDRRNQNLQLNTQDEEESAE